MRVSFLVRPFSAEQALLNSRHISLRSKYHPRHPALIRVHYCLQKWCLIMLCKALTSSSGAGGPYVNTSSRSMTEYAYPNPHQIKPDCCLQRDRARSIPGSQDLINHTTDPPTATTTITVRIHAPTRSPVLIG
jgi:hypothetical protein